ncbi:hypothetical protein GCM10011391_29460 [Pullulanibacillus camelliae]|uniref:Uncharacterized protein n=1 Tax=Pullulanibacillus camelliae TaxID=1707096 RepID=A0A8J3DW33_9BACL|nr:DUF5370 family protein [Pullulanibacillus camelliae]GGE48740.1 hypothetical protein GCM10011391_29460 [Pullulanibacillus camelliae]
MGAIQRDGYTFDVEYSVVLQRAALHVYQDGTFIKEVPFAFSGQAPTQDDIDKSIEAFLS